MSAPATNARSPAPSSTIARTASSRVEPVELGLELLEQRSRERVDGRVVDRDDGDCAVDLARDELRQARPSPPAARFANCSRRAVLRNLPTAVFGISSTNSNRSGSHHLAKFGREELAQLVVGRRRPLPQHDDRERPLRPLLVGHGDDRGLGDGRVAHERVLERDRGDPLAARLDEVLRAVLDLDVAVRLDGDDVAGLEPAVVRPAVRAVRRVVVGGRDPDAAHLELAHRLAVPRHEALGAARADLDERRRDALLGAVAVLLVLGQRHLAARELGDGAERAHLGHAPRVDDLAARGASRTPRSSPAARRSRRRPSPAPTRCRTSPGSRRARRGSPSRSSARRP